MVYVTTASSSMIAMPFTKLRMRAFRSGKVPSWPRPLSLSLIEWELSLEQEREAEPVGLSAD